MLNSNGKIAETKGKQLPLVICYKPLLGYFIGTNLEEQDNKRIFTKESVEVFDSLIDINTAIASNSWMQSLDCQIFESD